MGKYNASVEKLFHEMPPRIRALPVSKEGYPVPWFVSMIKGEWNFVAVDQRKPMEAHRRGICWVCGGRLGTYRSFAIGPMCAVNRVTAEPPGHLACMEFSVKACPFLSRPKMTRNYKTMPEDQRTMVPGLAIDRNPGVVLVWTTRNYSVFKPQAGHGYMFRLGDPIGATWWAQGRTATRAEIDHSIETGMPLLKGLAEAEGADAVAELKQRYEETVALLPEAV